MSGIMQMLFGPGGPLAPPVIDVGDIANSLRFRGAQSLTRTTTIDAGSSYSIKCKRGKLGAISPLLETTIRFNANDTLTAFNLTTTAVFRDPTAWLYIDVSDNGLYVNGSLLGAVTTTLLTNPRIGYDGTNYATGYMARFCVSAGVTVPASNFGYLNTTTNSWVTRTQAQVKAVVDAGGTNSFMLEFDVSATIGKDFSAKGNDWTPNGFNTTTAGNTYDWMLDTPSNNYATWNPLDTGSTASTFANGNLSFNAVGGAATYRTARATIPITEFDCYWEVPVVNLGTSIYVGVARQDQKLIDAGTGQVGFAGLPDSLGYRCLNGDIYKNGAIFSAQATPVVGDVLMFAVQVSTGKLFMGNNGTWFNSGNPVAGTGQIDTLNVAYDWAVALSSAVTLDNYINFGQAPLLTGATWHVDAKGWFKHAPPTGYKALCQANLAEAGVVKLSGSFTGNANAFGPFIWMNGVPKTLSIDGGANLIGGTSVDKLAGGFKLRIATGINTNAAHTWTATIDSDLQNVFKFNNAQGSP